MRPLGVTALEDKIVQHAAVEVMNAIYETDFLGFSYGFRPKRSQHNALDALYTGLLTKKVNWVLDLDICGFFACPRGTGGVRQAVLPPLIQETRGAAGENATRVLDILHKEDQARAARRARDERRSWVDGGVILIAVGLGLGGAYAQWRFRQLVCRPHPLAIGAGNGSDRYLQKPHD